MYATGIHTGQQKKQLTPLSTIHKRPSSPPELSQRLARSMAAALKPMLEPTRSMPAGVMAPEGAGVVLRVGGADRLCCMCALTR